MLKMDPSGLIERPDGRGYMLAEPATATPAPAPKAAATKTGHLVDHLVAENSRLRKDLAEQPKEAETPRRDPLAYQVGDNMARYARGVRFAKPRTAKTFQKGNQT